MLSVLQVAVSLIFFANKVLLQVEKKTEKIAWILGTIAACLAVVYFLLLELYVYTVLEAGLIIFMGYGAIKKEESSEKVKMAIRIFLLVVMLVLTFFVFKGMMTIVEFSSSAGLLFGTYLLTHSKMSLGWTLYALSHLGSAYIGQIKTQFFYRDFQIASSLIALGGILKSYNN